MKEALETKDFEALVDAIMTASKQPSLSSRETVEPLLLHDELEVRSCAVKALGFYWGLRDFSPSAIEMATTDVDDETRSNAVMSIRCDSPQESEFMSLVAIILNENESNEFAREVAFRSCLSVLGLPTWQQPQNDFYPNFEAKADWKLLADYFERNKLEVPAAIRDRAEAQPHGELAE